MGYGDYIREKYAGSNVQPWYERELELIDDWDEREFKGRSVSSTREILGHHAWGERSFGSENDVHGKLNKVSAEIARLMNTVLNSEKGKAERVLSIAWSNGKSPAQNAPNSDAVTLSPDLVVGTSGRADKSDNPEIIDGLGGQVLLGSTLKRTMSMKAFTTALEDTSPLAKHNRMMWEAAETAKAKQALITEWPGFAPYLKRHQALTSSEQEQVQAFIDSKPDKLSVAVAAAAWTVANPRQPLTLSPKIGDAVRKVAEQLNESTSIERYISAVNAVKYLSTILDEDEEPPTDGGGGGEEKEEGEEKGEGSGGSGVGDEEKDEKEKDESEKSDGGGKGDEGSDNKEDSEKGKGSGDTGSGDSEPPPTPPEITDHSLFGAGVGSSHKNVPSDMLVTEDKTAREHPEIPPGCCKIRPVTYLDPSKYQGKGYERNYPGYVKECASLTRAIQNALRFRRTAPAYPLRGLLSGDLDDGSLDKLALREQHPAVFERPEIASVPDVAIAILVDESGSMGCVSCSKRTCRYESARLVCISLVEAFRKLRGLNLMVFGHTQYERDGVDMFEYLSPTKTDPTKLAYISARSDNPDGFAMEEAIKRLAAAYPSAQQKYLFVLSDGLPAAHGSGGTGSYGGEPAFKHMAGVCKWGLRRFGIHTFGIGIDGSPSQVAGEKMYGTGHFVCLPNVLGSARIISTFLARVSARV